MQIRTDLALEMKEIYHNSAVNKSSNIEGVLVENQNLDDINITRVDIFNEQGADSLKKRIGKYTTLEIPNLTDNLKDLNDKVEKVLASEIDKLVNFTQDGNYNVLVVGLGNWNVTPDALGPKVIDKIAVTRHLKRYATEYIENDANSVCAVAPGVLGITGIETAEIIKGLVEKVKPNLIIAIDALASRRMDRISTTIQISDAGITPGSGVGNTRMDLNKETLGVPVIAIGIPTVVDAITIASDAIDLVIDEITKKVHKNSEVYVVLNNIKEQNKEDFTGKVLSPFIGNLVVTPKEIDEIITNVSHIVANAINIAIHGSMDEAQKYII